MSVWPSAESAVAAAGVGLNTASVSLLARVPGRDLLHLHSSTFRLISLSSTLPSHLKHFLCEKSGDFMEFLWQKRLRLSWTLDECTPLGPGLGKSAAERILAHRTKNGAFANRAVRPRRCCPPRHMAAIYIPKRGIKYTSMLWGLSK